MPQQAMSSGCRSLHGSVAPSPFSWGQRVFTSMANVSSPTAAETLRPTNLSTSAAAEAVGGAAACSSKYLLHVIRQQIDISERK
jgi:hypothetical protein